MPAEGETGGTGLVHVANLGSVGGQALVEPVQSVGVGGDVAIGSDLAGGIGNGDGDGFGVDIEADVFNDARGGWRDHRNALVAGFAEKSGEPQPCGSALRSHGS